VYFVSLFYLAHQLPARTVKLQQESNGLKHTIKQKHSTVTYNVQW